MRTVLCSQLYVVVQQQRNADLNVFSFSTRVDNIWLVIWASLMYHVAYVQTYHISALLNTYQKYLAYPKDHI